MDRARDDEVFQQLVLARVVEPTRKLDSIRVLEDIGDGAVLSDDQATPAVYTKLHSI